MASWDITKLSSDVEFDTTNGTYNTSAKIDSTHIINAWTGTDGDGFIQAFSLNPATGVVAAIGSPLEFDTENNIGSSIVQVDANHFLLVWRGGLTGSHLKGQIFTVNLSTWAVTAEGSPLAITGAGGGAGGPDVIFLQGTKYVVAFAESAINNAMVLNVNTSTWAVTAAGSALGFHNTVSSVSAKSYALSKIADDRFICFWTGFGDDGFVQTFSVNTSTWAISEVGSEVEFDTTNATYLTCSQIDQYHYIAAWSGSGADGFARAFTVNSSTYAVTAEGTALEFDTVNGTFNSLAKVDANHFVNAWAGSGIDGFIRVLEVNLSTWAVTAVGTSALEFDTTNGSYSSCIYMGNGVVVVFWSGSGADGFVNSFKIEGFTNPPSTTVTLSSPADTATTADTTPDLVFTGTDQDADDIRYRVQVHDATFPSTAGPIDDFNDGAINLITWNKWGGANVAEGSGVLTITTTTSIAYYGMETYSAFDFTGKQAFIEFTSAGNQSLSSFEIFPVTLKIDDNNKVEIGLTGGNIISRKVVTGTPTILATEAYNSTNHRWLRIRESGGTTYWERSADGLSWTTMHSVSNPIAVTALKVSVSAGCWQAEASATSATFDNLNIYPATINKVSGTDSGFSGSPDNADPFTSGQAVTYTVQSELAPDTYYWRVIGIDPSGTSEYGTWSETRSFTVESSGEEVAEVDPVSSSFSVVNTTATYESVQTATVAPVSSTFSIPDVTATYQSIQTASVASVTTLFSIVATTATFLSVWTASVAPVTANLSSVDTTATYEQINTATVDPITSSFTVVDPTATYIQVETADVDPVTSTMSVVDPTATYQAVINAVVAPVTGTLSVVETTATHSQNATASVDPVSGVLSVVDTTATYDEVDSATVEPVTGVLSVIDPTASYIQVETASVASVSGTLSVIDPTATFLEVSNADVDPSALQLTTIDPTATYIQVETATVEPVGGTLSVTDPMATYIRVESAVVEPVTLTFSQTNITGTYVQNEVASVSSIATSLGVVETTATYSMTGTASIDPVTAIISLTDTTATYQEVDSAIVEPIIASFTVIDPTATYGEDINAQVEPITVTLSVPEVTATYQETFSATVEPISVTLSVVDVGGEFHISAAVEPLSLTVSIPDVMGESDAIQTASVDPVVSTLSVLGVTATYIEIDTAQLVPVTGTLSVVETTATHSAEYTASVSAISITLSVVNVTATSSTEYVTGVEPVSIVLSIVTTQPTYIYVATASVQPLTIQISVVPIYAQTNIFLGPIQVSGRVRLGNVSGIVRSMTHEGSVNSKSVSGQNRSKNISAVNRAIVIE